VERKSSSAPSQVPIVQRLQLALALVPVRGQVGETKAVALLLRNRKRKPRNASLFPAKKKRQPKQWAVTWNKVELTAVAQKTKESDP
jgi:hypothetical protein